MNTFTLPRWLCRTLLLPCIAAGVWASWISLQYFIHGAHALEADPAMQVLATSAAVMLVALGMSAFGLAALMTERELWLRRHGLTAFAWAMAALEVCTIIAVQMALTVGADMSQSAITGNVADLERQISQAEAQAKRYSSRAEALQMGRQLTLAKRTEDLAAAELKKTGPLYEQLAAARNAKRPTVVGLLGREAALIYVVFRGILISIGGMVFLGVAGVMLRRSLMPIPGESAPAAKPAPAPAVSLAKVAPMHPHRVSYGVALAGAGIVGMGAAVSPPAHSAPAAPTAPAPQRDATTVPAKVASIAPSAPAQVQAPALVQVQKVAPVAQKRTPKAAPTAPAQAGTRTKEVVLKELVLAVRAGTKKGGCNPTQRSIRDFVDCGQKMADWYLAGLAKLDVIEAKPSGKGWQLKGVQA